MKKELKNIIEIASVYTGTVVGAGFASGQEMIQFFASYGVKGIYGIVLAGILQALLGWVVLEIVYTYRYSNYKQLINVMAGEKIATLLNGTVSFFMLICFCAMLAGCGALCKQQFNISVQWGIAIMAIVCTVTFFYGVDGVIKTNAVLAPLLLIGEILLGFYLIMFRDVTVFRISSVWKEVTNNWIVSSIIYVSYNTLTACVVLCALHQLLSSRKVARLGGMLGGITLGFIGLCIGIPMLLHYDSIQGLEVPVMGLLMHRGIIMQYIYLFVLLIAMFTTAVANGYGFLERISEYVRIPWSLLIVIFIVVSVIISQIKFSHIVAKIYPLFGYIGLFEIILIFVYYISMKITK